MLNCVWKNRRRYSRERASERSNERDHSKGSAGGGNAAFDRKRCICRGKVAFVGTRPPPLPHPTHPPSGVVSSRASAQAAFLMRMAARRRSSTAVSKTSRGKKRSQISARDPFFRIWKKMILDLENAFTYSNCLEFPASPIHFVRESAKT